MVEEPSVNDTIAIFVDQRKYEVHHEFGSATHPSFQPPNFHRYITDRHLPDKAVDLIDEASSALRMQIDSMPENLIFLNVISCVLVLNVKRLKRR